MDDFDERNSFISNDSHFYDVNLFLPEDDHSENDLFIQSCHTTVNLEE